MSSSFSDPSPSHDPRPEEGYTPTPPPPNPVREAPSHGDGDIPRLGSLAQKARGKQLKTARNILFFLGGFSLLVNGVFLCLIPSLIERDLEKEIMQAGGYSQVDPAQVAEVRNERLFLNYAITGGFLIIGILFIIFGTLVYRFPLAMTVTGLVLYLLATVIMVVVNPASLASGIIVRIIFIVALVKSIQSAYAYEKERRVAEDYSFNG